MGPEHVLVRYGEIGTKCSYVRHQMKSVLRQRVEDRLKYEDIPFERVSEEEGRVVVETSRAEEAAEKVSELPGVQSVSPALRTGASMESLKEASREFDYGSTFGVDARRAGSHGFSSRDVEKEVGAVVEDFSGSVVDLEEPDTWLGIEVRFDQAYLFTSTLEGPGGYPVGTQEPLLALISGGIDSPVAAYQVMKRGADITPVYFYNRPFTAGDHWLRFQEVVDRLKRFHPGKKWEVYKVDMEEVNQVLQGVGRGRMVVHRRVMFRTAERIAADRGFRGIVTGESMGQKSSQTVQNLAVTSSAVELPVHRPLLAWNKDEITEVAREIGTYGDSKVASGCNKLAPDNPATSLGRKDLEELEKEVGIDSLVEEAVDHTKKLTV